MSVTGHTLVLLRHAKSSWATELPDVERPLNDRGRRDADAAGRWLVDAGLAPGLVLCSPAVRTRETWSRVARSGGPTLASAPVHFVDAIYEAWVDTLLALVRDLDEQTGTAVLVGHGPGLPHLAEQLNRLHGDGPVGDFPTSATAVFAVEGPWAQAGAGSARLTAYAVPRG